MQCFASPTRAIRPLWMATSVCSRISCVQTLTSFASVMTVSAGTRPIATEESVAEHSQRGTLQNLLIMLLSFPILRITAFSQKKGRRRKRSALLKIRACGGALRASAYKKPVVGQIRGLPGRNSGPHDRPHYTGYELVCHAFSIPCAPARRQLSFPPNIRRRAPAFRRFCNKKTGIENDPCFLLFGVCLKLT